MRNCTLRFQGSVQIGVLVSPGDTKMYHGMSFSLVLFPPRWMVGSEGSTTSQKLCWDLVMDFCSVDAAQVASELEVSSNSLFETSPSQRGVWCSVWRMKFFLDLFALFEILQIGENLIFLVYFQEHLKWFRWANLICNLVVFLICFLCVVNLGLWC